MKFLHLNPSMRPHYGGPANWIANAGRLLIEQGHASDTICGDAPDEPSHREWGVPVVGLGPSGPGGWCPSVKDWLEENATRYDVVILHNIWDLTHPLAWSALRWMEVRTWVFPHGMLDPWFNTFPLKKLKKQLYWPWAVRDSIRNSEATLFTTEEERLLARRSFRPYEPRESVISYGIPRPSFDPEAAAAAFRKALPELEGRPYLLYLSRIHPKKGCDLLVQALAEAPRDVHLVMAGPDEAGLRSGLVKTAQEMGAADRIHWPGILRGDAKWGALSGCQAFVLPSHQENFGQAVAEAMAVGRPVLITDKVNIHREVSGFGAGIVESDDLEGTRRAVSRLCAMSGEERSAMGRMGEACFAEKFEISRSVEDLLRLAENPLELARPWRGQPARQASERTAP